MVQSLTIMSHVEIDDKAIIMVTVASFSDFSCYFE